LTNEITENAWKPIEEVEELGGMTKAIESEFRNLESKKQRPENKRIDSGQDIIVGVNHRL
jgi:methylmalonyl-CoA mutase